MSVGQAGQDWADTFKVACDGELLKDRWREDVNGGQRVGLESEFSAKLPQCALTKAHVQNQV